MLPTNHAWVRGVLAVLVILVISGSALAAVPTLAARIWAVVSHWF